MPGGTDMLGKWKSVVLLTTLTDRARQAISGLQPIAACPHVLSCTTSGPCGAFCYLGHFKKLRIIIIIIMSLLKIAH